VLFGGTALASVAGEQPRGPQFVRITQLLRLPARQRCQPGFRFQRDRRLAERPLCAKSGRPARAIRAHVVHPVVEDHICGRVHVGADEASSGTFQVAATSFTERTQILRRLILTQERVSEIDLISAIYPLSVHRRVERQWAERIKSLRQIRGLVVAATERAFQRVFNDGSLIQVPVRTAVDRIQLDRSQPHD
jgi:hypothetical protein